MVPTITGNQPVQLEWLWESYNGHRLVLQKTIYLILLKASGNDFRIGGIFNAIIVGGLTLAMIFTARYVRGQTQLADAFFPLVLLHPGHLVHFLFGFNIYLVFSTMLFCAWLLIIVRGPWPLSPNVAVVAGLLLVLLPVSAANGFLFTPFVALWLAAGALLYQRDTSPRWIVPFQSTCVIISIALAAGLYLIGFPAYHGPPYAGFGPTVVYGFRFIGMAIGPIGAAKGSAQLIPGFLPKLITGGLFFGATFLLLASSIIPLWRGFSSIRTPEGSRFLGFLMSIAAIAVLALVMALGRAGWKEIQVIPDTYAMLSAPALCAAYFAWLLYGPETARDRITIVFAITALLALPFNIREGLAYRDSYVGGMQAFEQDLAVGLSARELGDKHYDFLFPWDRDALIEWMLMLHEAKIGPIGTAPNQGS